MRRTTLVLAVVLVGLVLGSGSVRAQSVPGSPTTVTVVATAVTLRVTWSAPAELGGSAVTAYHVRHIESAADATDDDNWTVALDAWATGGGDLGYTIEGLLDSTSYKVGVRAVNAQGPSLWTDPLTISTPDHGRYISQATPLPVGGSLRGQIDTGDEGDLFEVTLPAAGRYWVFTTGELDTQGTLWDVYGLGRQTDGHTPRDMRQFSIIRGYEGGTNHILVEAEVEGATGTYTIHLRSVADPGDTKLAAQEVTLGQATGAILRVPGEVDYFRFTLTETTDVAIESAGWVHTRAQLLREDETEIAAAQNGYVTRPRHEDSNFQGFMMRRTLDAGSYLLKVSSVPEVIFGFLRPVSPTGAYFLLIEEPADPGSSRATATPLALRHTVAGRVSSASDEDYYSLTVDKETYVTITAVPYGTPFPLVPTFFDADGTDLNAYVIRREEYGYEGRREAFAIITQLAAGAYYVRVKAPDGGTGGPYVLSAWDTDYGQDPVKRCTDIASLQSDPLYGCQWHLKNTRQLGIGVSEDINVEGVWETNKGEGINVVVVDTMVQPNHEDLVGTPDDPLDADDDKLGRFDTARSHDYYDRGLESFEPHGTNVAGLIAARANDVGVRGVAPEATIYSFNLIAQNPTDAQRADAFTRHMDVTAISNHSYGAVNGGTPSAVSGVWRMALERAVTEGYDGKGVFITWAAGNDGDYGGWASLDERTTSYAVTAVCAIDIKDRRPVWSNRGPNLWICAPGHDLTSTRTANRYTRKFAGTSGATPIVAGVAALVRAANPDLTWRDVKLILANSARENHPSHTRLPGALKYGSSSERYSFSYDYGFGAVDAGAAVALAKNWTDLPSLRKLEVSSDRLDIAIPDATHDSNFNNIVGKEISTSLKADSNFIEFIEFIELEVSITHGQARNLLIQLDSPSTTTSEITVPYFGEGEGRNIFEVLLGINWAARLADMVNPFTFGTARHLGEGADGEWTLRIRDDDAVIAGTLHSWKLTFYGHGYKPGFPTLRTRDNRERIRINFDPPEDTGATPITSYDLRYIRANVPDKSDESLWTVVTGFPDPNNVGHNYLRGLLPGRRYDLQIRAVNATGAGPWSAASRAGQLPEPPRAPAIGEIVPRDRGLGVTWSAPEENGGTFINSYDLSVYDLSVSDATDKNDRGNWREFHNVWRNGDGDLTARISGLTNDVSYDVAVRARNGIGEGPWSTEVVTGMPAVQNRAPSFPPAETGARAIPEGPLVGRNVGAPVSAVDPDTGASLTYFLSSGDEFFRINSDTGQLLTRKALDHEAVASHVLIVDVSDSKNSSDDEDTVVDDDIVVTVTVTNVNERPMVMGTRAIDHAENEGTALANARYSATDPEGANITWSVGGIDKGFFAISSGGVLSFAAEPDFEAPADSGEDNVYNVIVRATEEDDVDPLTGSLAVTVTVTPVDEAPVITGPKRVDDYPENSLTTRVVGSYMAEDPEGAGVTWSDLSGNDADDFDLSNNGVLTFKVSPDYEQKSEYEVTLNAFDGGLTGSLDVTVTIANENERPTISGPVVVDFTENGTGTVEMYSATDPDVGATQAWSLAGADGSDFAITNGVLTFINPPDYDMPTDDSRPYNEYLVTVQVNDGANTVTRPVTVRVLDVNEAPTVSGKLTPSVEENSTAVATYTATDPERATITWSVEDPGAGDFTITNAGGALSFASAPNYEVKSSYTVTVRASDGTNTDDHVVTVAVTDVNEPEVLVLSHRTPLIGEEFTAAFEGTGDNVTSLTWQWRRSTNRSSAGTVIVGATAETYRPVGDDRDYYLRVTASYNDGHGQARKTLQATSEFATLPDSTTNTAPTFPSTLFTGGQTGLSVRENAVVRTVVGVAPQATDTDPGSRSLSYSLAVDGFPIDPPFTDPPFTGPPFEINASSREIRVASGAVLDHEDQETYSVTVTVVDEFNATDTATFDITIDDVNERPVAVADPAVTTAEDTPVTFDVLGNDTDPDEGDTLTVMTITTQPRRGRVVADPGTQMLTYTPAKDDHDTYMFMYTASDDDPVRRLTSPPARVTVTINAVNDAPEFATEMTTRTVSESAQPGDEVGTKVEATDVDDITLTYSLSGASEFVIDDTGQISVAPRVTLDRERISSYEATVTATDRLNESDSITVTINVSDVPEPPTAMNDTAKTAEDQSVKIDVLDNDTDPDTERAALRVSVLTQPLNGRARVESDRTITYTPKLNFADRDPFTYRLSDGSLTDDGSVTVTVTPVNDAPTFPSPTAARSVPESAKAGANVGAPVTATDVDNAMLTYSLVPGVDASSFDIDSDGQITVATGATLDIATKGTYTVTVEARDPGGDEARVEVTITVTAGPVLPPIIIITGGGGGGGGPSGPSPSEVDFEWTVKRDIEELDGGNDWPTGLWSDGETLWIAENGQGADDEVYAYDRASGERVEEREFALAETNRAPRGFWSDGVTVWVSDSGRERLFAYRLADGERLEEREFALAEGNSDVRGIWSDEETMWVLDGRADRLFAYALASGELLAEYELDAANSDPHGLWSDGVTVWVSDHGAKRLFAYRLEGEELERNRDEEFGELSKASNNSPRGIWSDGDFMYVADESDDRVYTYNMPDAIDARLASLTLSGVDIGEFDPGRTDYEAVVADGVTETTVEAEAMQRRTDVTIDPPDADGANGHQVALQDLGEITVTVTSADGSRKKVYRVRFPETGWDPIRDPWPHCLRGAVSEGFSLVVHEGGSVEELVACAESRGIVAFYALHDGAYVSYILGAPDFVNREFRELFADGLPPITPLVAGSDGPPSPDPFGDLEDGGQQPWPECLRGAVSEGFSLVVYEGGSVEELEACARSRDVTALYTLSEGEFVSYILGAPELVNQPFRDLFAGGLPLMTPLVARNEGQPGGR